MSDSLHSNLADKNEYKQQNQLQDTAHNLLQVSDIDNIWLLPDGVSDLLSEQAQKQEWLRHTLIQLLVGRGYALTGPPMIEFTESLLGNASEDLKRQTFKIIDQLSGRLMGVRADITPQISRIDAYLSKLGQASTVSRYCYAGHVIRTLPNGLFGSRTPLQLGAEIFGYEGLAADLELMDILYIIIDTLNLKSKLHIDIGHVGIFNRLKQLSGLSDTDSHLLMNLYANKALPDLKAKSAQLAMGEDFYHLAVYGHNMTALKGALSDAALQEDSIVQAINEVEQITAHITDMHQGNVSVDITELGYHYHTGIVFNGYFENDSQPVVRGGRFNAKPFSNATDDVQNSTRKLSARSAVGFSLELTRLLRRIELPATKHVVIGYEDLRQANNESLTKLDMHVNELRQSGYQVIRPLSADDMPYNVTHRLVYQSNNWALQAVES